MRWLRQACLDVLEAHSDRFHEGKSKARTKMEDLNERIYMKDLVMWEWCAARR